MLEKLKTKYYKLMAERNFAEVFSASVISFGTKIINLLLGFIFSIMITRLYGAEVMGVYSLVTSFLTFILMISIFGINTAIVRIIPEHIAKYSVYSAKLAYNKSLKVVLLLSFLVSIIIYFSSDFLASYFFEKEFLAPIFIFLSLFIVPQAILALSSQSLRALKEIKLFSIMEIANPLLKILLLIIIYLNFNYEYAPVYVLVISNAFFAIILTYITYSLLNKKISDTNIYQKLTSKKLFTLSVPMFLTSGMLVFILEIDTIMLAMFSTLEDVGVYAVVIKLAGLSIFMMGAINIIVGPKFSELFHSNKIKELEKIAKQSTKLAFFTSIPIFIVLIIFGQYLLSIFGEEFSVGYQALLFLVIGQMISTSAGPEGYFLNMTGHQVIYNYILIISAFINIVLNYFLIPLYGIEGAAAASMITKLVWMLIASIYIKHKFGFYIGYIPFVSRVK